MGNVGDIVLVEDTGDAWSGKPGRAINIIDDLMVDVKFGDGIVRTYPAENLGVVTEDSHLLIEKYCSVCHIMSYDNHSGGYQHTHVVEATGTDVACDYDGKVFVEGELVPPK